MNRLMTAPLLVLGAVALWFLVRGPAPSRSAQGLWEYLQAKGHVVEKVRAGEFFEQDYEELEGRVVLAEIDGHHVALRQMADVMRAMSYYRSMVHPSGPMAMAMRVEGQGMTARSPQLYRNENFVLEILGPNTTQTEELGHQFERW